MNKTATVLFRNWGMNKNVANKNIKSMIARLRI